MNKYYLSFMVVGLFSLSVCQLMAQQSLFIKPAIGLVYPFSSINQPSSSLQKSQFNLLSLQPGVDLQLALNKGWRFSLGLHYSAYGMSYKGRSMAGAANGNMIRVPLQLHYRLADNIRVLNLDPTRYAYLLMFRLYAIAALDYNSLLNKVSLSTAGSLQTDEVISVQPSVIKKWSNFSPSIGFGIQFFDKVDHDRFDISFYYSRGTSLLLYQDVTYQTQLSNEQIRFSSKGSLVGVNISYPIRFPL